MNTITQNTASHLSIRQLTTISVMTAITCILAPIALPIGPVPISLTNLVLYFMLYILDTKKALCSYLIYLLIGFIGLPVFSGFSGGVGKLFGPTGGYLIGFLPMTAIAGFFINRFPKKQYLHLLGMILGTAVCYGIGTLWLAYQADIPFLSALSLGVFPFLPGDAAKMISAILLAPSIQKRLKKAAVFCKSEASPNNLQK